MDRRALRLDEFIAEYRLQGVWDVDYTDNTHLPDCEYVRLGEFTIEATEETAQKNPILPYCFRPVTNKEIESRFCEIEKGKDQAVRAGKIICDQLADSMVRTGLLRPELCLMENQTVRRGFGEVMRKLSEHGYLVVVVDTSALRRAAASLLHKTLTSVLIWTVVPVFVMNEVQQKVAKLNTIRRKTANGNSNPGKCGILEERPQVSCISQELNRIRQWRPVEMLTTLPEHLGQSNGESRVDRLIIESLKNLKRDRGFHQGVYLLTGDKDMASLAVLENQGSLHINVPSLPLNTHISSVRYDPHNRQLVLTPVHSLLWDLALVFSTVRLSNKENSRKYELAYYSEARGGFFARDVMEIREL